MNLVDQVVSQELPNILKETQAEDESSIDEVVSQELRRKEQQNRILEHTNEDDIAETATLADTLRKDPAYIYPSRKGYRESLDQRPELRAYHEEKKGLIKRLISDIWFGQDELTDKEKAKAVVDLQRLKAKEDVVTKAMPSPGFLRSVRGGWNELQATCYGFAALGASGVGQKEERDWLLRRYQQNIDQGRRDAPTVRLRNVDSPADIMNWVRETGGRLVPSMTSAAGSALLGSLIAPGPGTFVGGVAGKTLLKKTVSKTVREYSEDMIQRGVIKKTQKEAVEKALKPQVEKRLLKELGAKAGVATAILPMEAGGNYGELATEYGVDAPWSSLAFAVPATALEFLGGNSRLIRRVLGRGRALELEKAVKARNKSSAVEIFRDAIKQAPEEMGQEMGQEGLAILNTVANTNERLFTVDHAWQVLEVGGAGFLGGFGGGASMKFLSYRKSREELSRFSSREEAQNYGRQADAVELDDLARAVDKYHKEQAYYEERNTPDRARTAEEQADFAKAALDAAISEEDIIPGGMNRQAFVSKLGRAFNLKPEEAEVHAKLVDARARRWADATERDPSEYYNEYFKDIVRGGRLTANERNILSQITEFGQDENVPINEASFKVREDPRFREWFGKSKVVDENVLPKVTYRGSATDISEFKKEHIKRNMGGFWFTENPDLASKYATAKGKGKNVMPVYLSISNPAPSVEFEKAVEAGTGTWQDVQARLKAKGYDGALKEDPKMGRTWIAFEPTQVKSVFNEGAWIEEDPRVLKQAEKGAVEFFEDNKAIIHALTEADKSTAPHELGHVFLREIMQTEPDFLSKIEGEFGVKEGKWEAKHEEAFVGSFLRWMREGKTTNPDLQLTFERFKQWLLEVYHTIKGTDIQHNLTDDMRIWFDEMLSGKGTGKTQEIETAAKKKKPTIVRALKREEEKRKEALEAPEVEGVEKQVERALNELEKYKEIEEIEFEEIGKRVKPQTIRQWIAKHGGVNPSDPTWKGELSDIRWKLGRSKKGKLKKVTANFPVGFFRKDAPSLDEVAAKAVEYGVLPEGSSDQELYDAIERNTEIFSEEDIEREFEEQVRTRKEERDVVPFEKATNVVQKSLKRAYKAGRDEAQEVRNSLIKYAEKNLPLRSRGKLLRAVKNAKTVETLEDQARRIDRERERNLVSKYKKVIKKELSAKEIKPRKQAGKPVGKFGPEVHDYLDKLSRLSRMRQDEAAEELSRRIKEKDITEVTAEEALENMVLGMASGIAKASNLQYLSKQITQIKKTGRSEMKAKQEEQNARFEDLRTTAKEVISGGEMPEFESTVKISDRSRKKVDGFFAQIGKTFVGWDNLMDMLSFFDKTAKPYESRLSKWANNFKWEREEEASIYRLQGEITKMAKDSLKLKTDRQISERFQKDAQVQDLGVFVNGRGKEVPLQFSKSYARKRWMELKDPDLRKVLFDTEKGMAYTSEIEKAIDNFLTNEDKAFALAQLEFYRKYYDRVNEVYSEFYGVNLPFNEFYSPIRREELERTEITGMSSLFQEAASYATVATGSLKSRTKNFYRIVEQSDIAVLQKHILEMEHFITWANRVKELKAVFGDPGVKAMIKAYYGDGFNEVLSKYLQDITRGGVSRAERIDSVEKLRIKFARSVLAAKPAMGVKQITSFIAFADSIPVKDFVEGTIDFFNNPVENAKTLLDTTYMKMRGQNITRDVRLAMETDEYRMFRRNPNFLNQLMMPLQMGDKGAIILGGWSVYKYHRNQGRSHEEALNTTMEIANSTQQSGDITQQSHWQRRGTLGKLATMFQSAPNMFFRKELSAFRNLYAKKGSKAEHLKTIAIYHILIPTFFQWVANGFDWDDEEQLSAAILGPFNGLFLIGNGLEAIARTCAGAHPFPTQIPMMGIANDAQRTVDAAVDLVSGSGDTEDVWRILRGLGEVGGAFTGFPGRQAEREVETTVKLVSGEKDLPQALLEYLGWSEYVLERKGEDSSWFSEVLRNGEVTKGTGKLKIRR